MFSRLRISTKLVLLNLTSSIVLLSITGVLLLQQVRVQNDALFQKRVDTVAELVASNVSAAVIVEDRDYIRKILQEVLADEAMLYAQVVDPRGRVLGRQGRPGHGSLEKSQLYITRLAVRDAERVIGELRLAASRKEVDDTVARAVREMLIITILALLVAALFSSRIQRHILTPIRRLSELTRKVRETNDYTLRAQVTHNDEVGMLTDDMNAMLAMIAERDRYLEDQVQARTLDLEHQADHDALSGLANRRVLNRKLMHACELWNDRREGFSIWILDLDQFKVVNDTAGHAAGDELLKQVSLLLTESVREDDLVVRLGGDEFAILLRCGVEEQVAKVAEGIRAKIENLMFCWESSVFRVSVSIGAVCAAGEQIDASTALQQADAACYVAKDRGRNQVYIVNGSDAGLEQHRGEMGWVERLHQGLEENSFTLFAQPIHALQCENAQVSRLEVLLRLRDRERNRWIPPGAFLPAAERYGLSVKVDRWVVEHTIACIDELQSVGVVEGDSHAFWINISGVSLDDAQFLQFLERSVIDSGLAPGTINIEVTETSAVQNLQGLNEMMAGLQQLGCKFALDDFGTGISSYSYLKRLPVDYLKIDGSFVREITRNEVDRIFVKSMIDIAGSLGIKTIVEFVEDSATLALVRELGADYAQGFYFGRPQPLLSDATTLAAVSGMDITAPIHAEHP